LLWPKKILSELCALLVFVVQNMMPKEQKD